jgi:hypothetical protein
MVSFFLAAIDKKNFLGLRKISWKQREEKPLTMSTSEEGNQ